MPSDIGQRHVTQPLLQNRPDALREQAITAADDLSLTLNLATLTLTQATSTQPQRHVLKIPNPNPNLSPNPTLTLMPAHRSEMHLARTVEGPSPRVALC